MSLENFLIVSAVLFSIGLYGALSKRNAIAVLMSIEIMFNAVNLAAVAFSRYSVPATLADTGSRAGDIAQALLTGQIFAIFIITDSGGGGRSRTCYRYRDLQNPFDRLRYGRGPDEEVEELSYVG